jgi:hypothetical protein
VNTLALFALIASAAPSMKELVGQRLYDEAFAARYSEPDREVWPSVVFPSPGMVLVVDGESEQFAFKVVGKGKRLQLKTQDSQGRSAMRFWRWLDDDRAETDLFWGKVRVVSRKSPTPWERAAAVGEQLARAVARQGVYRRQGREVLRLEADGGVRWAQDGGQFFACRLDCREDAGLRACLREGESEYLLVPDGGPAVQVVQVDSCGAREARDGGLQWARE